MNIKNWSLSSRLASNLFLASFGILLVSCGSYRQNIMFQVPEGHALTKGVQTAEQNYIIQKNDRLTLEVTTNDGESLIDPHGQMEDANAAKAPQPITYLVDINGVVRLPLVGDMKLAGLTIRQGEEILQKEFEKFYKGPFVSMSFANKRAFVLGAPGGQVIPLVEENMELIEVLALAKGVPADAKATNIRIIRKDQVFVADLTTLEGIQSAHMIIEPGDIIYVEPVRRPFSEAIREYGPVVSIISSLTTLIVVIYGLN